MFGSIVRVAVAGLGLLLPIEVGATPLDDLNGAFRQSYRLAQTHTLANLRATVPVLVNRFSQIALYRPGVERPEIFETDGGLFLETRAVAHSAATLYLRLLPSGFGRLDAERLEWLATFQGLIRAAEDEVAARTDLPGDLKPVQLAMLAEVRRVAERIHQRGEVDEATLVALGATVRAATETGLHHAAASQLDQFRAQFERWRQQYPTLDWDHAVAIVIGTHQPRTLAWQRQFFDWMLRDEPRREDRVVFAESLTVPAPIDGPDLPTDAFMLLASVMLDKQLAGAILGDPLALQTDALGPAAQAIIRGWPAR
ncbi:MAG: uncharacterized protein JWR10_2844 [Rubritepida sp.]|nr:uncharacterized protein [Rubritepida sp.]